MTAPDAQPTLPPAKYGVCEYCLRETTVYAYALWVCKRCLDADPARDDSEAGR